MLAAEEWPDVLDNLVFLVVSCMWQNFPLAYVCAMPLPDFILTGVILVLTNIYVFIFSRNRRQNFQNRLQQAAKSYQFKSIKVNKIEDIHCKQIMIHENLVEQSGNECKINSSR